MADSILSQPFPVEQPAGRPLEHTLVLSRLATGQPAAPCTLSLVRRDQALYLRLVGDQLDLVFRAAWPDFFSLAATLLHLPESLPALSTAGDDDWTFSDEDLPDNIQPAADPGITLADLRPGDDARNWRLIARRFPWLFAKEVGFRQAQKYAQEILAGQATVKPAPSIGEQLKLDLARVRPHLGRIIHRLEGQYQFVYGYQSRIAEALGVPNEGGHRRRIKNVADALAREFGISTTTTTRPALKKAANG
jgi:hypothetical protein